MRPQPRGKWVVLCAALRGRHSAGELRPSEASLFCIRAEWLHVGLTRVLPLISRRVVKPLVRRDRAKGAIVVARKQEDEEDATAIPSPFLGDWMTLVPIIALLSTELFFTSGHEVGVCRDHGGGERNEGWREGKGDGHRS